VSHRRDVARPVATALALAFALALSACGDAAPPEPNMTISFSSRALLSDATFLFVYYFDDTQTCDDIRSQMPNPGESRPNAAVGPYMILLDNGTRSQGITFQNNDVPKGAYLIFIDAIDATGTIVGSGCAAHQIVFDRRVSHTKITIS